MEYSKPVNMIADYLKPFCKELLDKECITIYITNYVTLSVSGGFGCDIRISDERPQLRYYHYYNEFTDCSGNSNYYADGRHHDGFGAFREMPEWIAEELVLNWKSIKETFLAKREKVLAFREEKRKKLVEFEI